MLRVSTDLGLGAHTVFGHAAGMGSVAGGALPHAWAGNRGSPRAGSGSGPGVSAMRLAPTSLTRSAATHEGAAERDADGRDEDGDGDEDELSVLLLLDSPGQGRELLLLDLRSGVHMRMPRAHAHAPREYSTPVPQHPGHPSTLAPGTDQCKLDRLPCKKCPAAAFLVAAERSTP